MEIKMVSVADIIPYENNPRKNADADVMGVRHEYAVPAFKGGKGLQVGRCEHRLILSVEAACGDDPRSRSAVIIIPAEREM